VSPDQQWALYSSGGLDWKTNRRTTDLWLVRTNGQDRRRLTWSPERTETAMSWARDSSGFYFLAPDAKRIPQIYRMAIDGGEPQPLTNEPDGVRDFELNPDGSLLVYRAGPTGRHALSLMDAAGRE